MTNPYRCHCGSGKIAGTMRANRMWCCGDCYPACVRAGEPHNYGFQCVCGFAEDGYHTRQHAIAGANRHGLLEGCIRSHAWAIAIAWTKDGRTDGGDTIPF